MRRNHFPVRNNCNRLSLCSKWRHVTDTAWNCSCHSNPSALLGYKRQRGLGGGGKEPPSKIQLVLLSSDMPCLLPAAASLCTAGLRVWAAGNARSRGCQLAGPGPRPGGATCNVHHTNTARRPALPRRRRLSFHGRLLPTYLFTYLGVFWQKGH